jgi:uncharacterized protein (TIGR02600 family)
MKPCPPPPHNRGAALIAVLALIVLMAALVTIFLVRTATERSASASYDAAAGTRLLAETTVNLVQATINQATTGTNGTAWASQPGAIRLFNDSGALTRIFRLYSGTAVATDTSSGSVLAGDVPPGNWASQPAAWVDLNKPVTVTGISGSNSLVFPILDPRNPQNPGSATAPTVLTSMDGFSINSAPGSTGLQPAPMPVRWLYVLRDGQIVTPTNATTTTVTVPGATSENPITGRIAYWTDDETAKVNVNTAAGSFSTWSGTTMPATWDTPRFRIWSERMLFSENQPVKGEYQRYPGHPATTDVSKIFSALGVTMPNYPYVVSTPTTSPQAAPANGQNLPYTILPRYTDDNSSQGGSRNTTRNAPPPVINNGVAKSDRLYPSAGEALFASDRTSSTLNRQQMETGKFFLTAHSRSPETTLFGTPRIAMWPINKDTGVTKRTTFDNLLAFCATTGTGSQAAPYYIQRGNAFSTTEDGAIPRNRTLFSYLQNLTSRQIPGFGGSFASKYSYALSGATERDQILAEIFDYIRSTNLWDHSVSPSNTAFSRFTAIPAGAGTFGFKGVVNPMQISAGSGTVHGLGRAQTLSEIGILIICTADGNSPLGPYVAPATVSGQPVSPVKGSANDPLYASNLPVAQYLRNNSGTDGQIIGLDNDKNPVVGSETAPPAGANPFPANPTLTTSGLHGGPLQALAPGEKKLQAMLLFEIASPMMGYDAMQFNVKPALRINVTGIQGISIDGQNPFPSRTTTTDDRSQNTNGNGVLEDFPTRTGAEQGTGGLLGFRYALRGRMNTWSGKEWLGTFGASTRPYRFISNPFTVDSSAVSLGGGFITELQVPTAGGGGSTYQTFNITFPNVQNVPTPDLMKTGLTKGSASASGEPQDVAADWWGFDLRIRQASSAAALQSKNTNTPLARIGAVIRADAPANHPEVATWTYASKAAVEQPSFSNQGTVTKFGGSDVVRTLVAKDGDYRLAAAQGTVAANGAGSSPFEKGPGYDSGAKLGNVFRDHYSAFATAGTDLSGKLVNGAPYGQNFTPKVPGTITAAKQTWDWDNGLPAEADGAYANKADEGNIYVSSASPYYNREQAATENDNILSYFTPNRIISSAGMLGSLPTGVLEGVSWRTLLFRPQASRPQDPSGPKDHLLLDLFNMPVVEPYAIGEPFSTDGKVNMNYQIVPFTYINRNAGVRAVLGTEMVTRVPRAAANQTSAWEEHVIYKPTGSTNGPSATPAVAGGVALARLPLNLSETNGSLRQFKEKFDAWDIFKSPSEICDIYLVPEGYSWASNADADAAWYGDDFALVGDNVRERPYANIYPRLTTKSNTFTVHYTVQALKNPPGANPEIWNASRGVVTGELRGSTTLERFLDPADSKIPDYAANPNSASLDTFYQWRVISANTFAP